jgi:hypothetical protein
MTMRVLYVGLMSLLLAACIPTRYDYFQPSGDGTRRSSNACDATPNAMEFTVAPGITAMVVAYGAAGGSLDGLITYRLPKSSGPEILPELLVMNDTSDPSGAKRLQPTVKPRWNDRGDGLFVNFTLPKAPEKSFDLQVPSLSLRDQKTASPVVRYDKVRKAVWKPLCM